MAGVMQSGYSEIITVKQYIFRQLLRKLWKSGYTEDPGRTTLRSVRETDYTGQESPVPKEGGSEK